MVGSGEDERAQGAQLAAVAVRRDPRLDLVPELLRSYGIGLAGRAGNVLEIPAVLADLPLDAMRRGHAGQRKTEGVAHIGHLARPDHFDGAGDARQADPDRRGGRGAIHDGVPLDLAGIRRHDGEPGSHGEALSRVDRIVGAGGVYLGVRDEDLAAAIDPPGPSVRFDIRAVERDLPCHGRAENICRIRHDRVPLAGGGFQRPCDLDISEAAFNGVVLRGHAEGAVFKANITGGYAASVRSAGQDAGRVVVRRDGRDIPRQPERAHARVQRAPVGGSKIRAASHGHISVSGVDAFSDRADNERHARNIDIPVSVNAVLGGAHIEGAGAARREGVDIDGVTVRVVYGQGLSVLEYKREGLIAGDAAERLIPVHDDGRVALEDQARALCDLADVVGAAGDVHAVQRGFVGGLFPDDRSFLGQAP